MAVNPSTKSAIPPANRSFCYMVLVERTARCPFCRNGSPSSLTVLSVGFGGGQAFQKFHEEICGLGLRGEKPGDLFFKVFIVDRFDAVFSRTQLEGFLGGFDGGITGENDGTGGRRDPF